jgi:Icc-related predicted phosphoesterase
MKVVVISDTHNQEHRLGHLSGDVLIHCGDLFNLFSPKPDDLARLDAWFGTLAFDAILVTGGNHDLALESALAHTQQPFSNAKVLVDAGVVIGGVRFYGSPWVPELSGHAFYANAEQLRIAWQKIPTHTDVLITHTPPANILDESRHGLSLGCPLLAYELQRIVPKVHCFGHVHASAGSCEAGSDGRGT